MDNEVHMVDGKEYLPEQKPINIWTTFSPKIESKITLRKTQLLRRKSMEILGSPAIENQEEENVLRKAVLSPPPRARKNSKKNCACKCITQPRITNYGNTHTHAQIYKYIHIHMIT